jgi:hypothetical protein
MSTEVNAVHGSDGTKGLAQAERFDDRRQRLGA